MPFLYLSVTSSVYIFVSIFMTGFSLICVSRFGKKIINSGLPNAILSSVAAGLYFNSVVFVISHHFSANFASLNMIVCIFALNITVIVSCFSTARARNHASLFIREVVICRDLLLLAPVCFAIGIWALYEFPHTFDSGQLFWTQSVLSGHLPKLPLEPMLGFSALIAWPAAFTPDLPLVTSAAGFKPFLMILALLVAGQATYALDLRPRLVAASAYLILMMVSSFGSFGLFATGKDSVFGVLFMVAMLITMSREDAENHGIEIGLYLAAASLTGIIAVPYAGVAYGLWLLFAFPQAALTLPAVYLINLPTLPLILSTFTHRPYLGAYLAFLGLGAVVVGMMMLHGRYGHRLAIPKASIWMSGFLWAAIATCAVFMPIAVQVEVGLNAEGAVDIRSMPPVDGKTTLFDMFAIHVSQTVGVALGLSVILLIGLTPYGRRRPGLVAAGATPFVSLLLVIIHYKLNLHVISSFNTWDLSKDIPLWLGGALISLFAVIGVSILGEKLSGYVGSAIGLVCLSLLGVWYAFPVMNVPSRLQPVYFNHVTGSDNSDMAVVSQAIWDRLRGGTVYVYESSVLARDDYFFALQMFGAKTYKINATLSQVALTGASGFVIAPSMVSTMLARAKSESASVTYIPGTSSDLMMFVVDNDRKGVLTIPSDVDTKSTQRTVEVVEGAYPIENFEDEFHFSWMKGSAIVRVITPERRGACVTLDVFGTTVADGAGNLVISENGHEDRRVPLSRSNIRDQIGVVVAVPAGAEETTILVRSDFSPVHFANDIRPLAFGLRRPISALPLETCHS